jgi:group I intron endonuclease
MKNIIYVYISPVNNEIFYVGKSIQGFKRANNIFAHKCHCRNTINLLKRLGYRPIIKILQFFDDNLSLKDLNEAEKYWISYFRSINCKLTNLTDGGEGSKGYKHTIEARKIMSMKASRSKGFKGHKHTKESLEKQRQAKLGKKLTISHKLAIGKAGKGKISHRKGKILPTQHAFNIKLGSKKRCTVMCLNDNNVFLSYRDAAKYYNTQHAMIRLCCQDGKIRRGLSFKKIE